MHAALIATGNELVEGRIHEGNNYFISQKLQVIGLPVLLHYVVGDNTLMLESTIRHALKSADVVIISGGLGPTVDDITFETLAKLFKIEPEIHEYSKQRMETFFKAIGKRVLPSDFKMVTVPKNAVIFNNDAGLAPGYALTIEGKEIIVLPGVPRELQSMIEKVLEYFLNKYKLRRKEVLTFKVVLKREAEVDSGVKEIVNDIKGIETSITYESGVTTVLLSATENNIVPHDEIILRARKLFGPTLIYGYNSLEEKIVKLFTKHGKTLSVAESCTGGLVSKRLTDIPGSSGILFGGVVAYSNDAKVLLLGVKNETLQKYGAVSQEVALEMALGAKERFGSDYAVATTGIAGPTGGTADKPVGLVCFGIAGNNTETSQIQFAGSREQIRNLAANYILARLLMHAGLE